MEHIHNQIAEASAGLKDHGCTTCGTDIPTPATGENFDPKTIGAAAPQQAGHDCPSCG